MNYSHRLFLFFLSATVLASLSYAETKTASVTDQGYAGYEKEFFVASNDNTNILQVSGRLQTRFHYQHEDVNNSSEKEYRFAIQRARLKLKGHISKKYEYEFQADFGKGNISLKDFYSNIVIAKEIFELRLGQFKKPFSRQQINSSGKLELSDRAITDSFFKAGRDIGIMIHNRYEKSPSIEYAFGVFNGTGESSILSGKTEVDISSGNGKITSGKFSNVPSKFKPLFVARVGINSEGLKGYSEGDLEDGELRYGIAISVFSEKDGDGDDNTLSCSDVDYVIKWNGIAFSGAWYYLKTNNTLNDSSFSNIGQHQQLSVLIAKIFQPAIRYASILDDSDTIMQQEITLGLGYKIKKHDIAWNNEIGFISDSDEISGSNYQYISQLQFVF